jgi:hypothetical protein
LTRAVRNFLQAAYYSLSGMHKRLPLPDPDLVILPIHVEMQMDLNLITDDTDYVTGFDGEDFGVLELITMSLVFLLQTSYPRKLPKR